MHRRPADRSWRMDESYVKVDEQWKYLYRALLREKSGGDADHQR